MPQALHRHLLPFIVAGSAVVLAGCAGVRNPVAYLSTISDQVSSLSYTADLRGTHFVKQADGRYWIISEPVSDAAFSYEDEQDLDLALLRFGGQTNSDEREGSMSGSEDLPLAGRTASVLLARELLFRLNETAHNIRPTNEQYIQLYQQTLQTIEAIAKIEAEHSQYRTTVNLSTNAAANLATDEKGTLSGMDGTAATPAAKAKAAVQEPVKDAAKDAAATDPIDKN